ncbi:RHS repeat-associated core domain-containing protein [Pseudomonas putida]|uniref:RHS repeat-associated core domain-containing protein n=1 Tax=Pseudomonas putida TaxID=303 RepID=UPI0009B84F9B
MAWETRHSTGVWGICSYPTVDEDVHPYRIHHLLLLPVAACGDHRDTQSSRFKRARAMHILTGATRMQDVGLHVYSAYGFCATLQPAKILLGFNGQAIEQFTMYYQLGVGYRSYAPSLLRFLSPDSLSPFGEGGVNAYNYCAGDPVNFQDPTGHMPKPTRAGLLPRYKELGPVAKQVFVKNSLDTSTPRPGKQPTIKPAGTAPQPKHKPPRAPEGPTLPARINPDQLSNLPGVSSSQSSPRARSVLDDYVRGINIEIRKIEEGAAKAGRTLTRDEQNSIGHFRREIESTRANWRASKADSVSHPSEANANIREDSFLY